VLGVRIPLRGRPPRGGLRQVLADRATWRDLGWLVVQVPVGLVLGTLGLFISGTPVFTVGSMAFWWLRPVVATVADGPAFVAAAAQHRPEIAAAATVVPRRRCPRRARHPAHAEPTPAELTPR
jgi:hypothetical protein